MKCSQLPVVSVVTPVFNGKRFIKRVVESVSLQNIHLEHLIVDDQSDDGTWEAIIELSRIHKWIIPIRQTLQLGPAAARNTAMKMAQGRFIAFLDVDDFWLPNKLEVQIEFMLKNNLRFTFCDYRHVSEDGLMIGRRLSGFNEIGPVTHHITRYIGCLTVVYDKEYAPDICFPEMRMDIRAEDFLFWSRCFERLGPAVRCPHDLARYSVVHNSRSSKQVKAALGVWAIYRQIDKKSLFLSIFYFSIYSVFSFWKRWRYKPVIDRSRIDNGFEWSVLK